MKRYSKLFLLSMILACLAVDKAMAEGALSWQDCIQEAQKNHPDLISAQEGVKQSQAARDITASALFPQLTGSLGASHSETDNRTSNTHSYGVDGSQLLFDGFRTVNNTRAAQENLQSSRQGYRFTSSQVRFRLRSAFINLLRSQELLKVTDEIVKIRKDNLALIALRYESGLEHKGARLTAEANLAAADFERSQARRELEVVQRQLTKEMGRTQFTPMAVEGNFTIADAVRAKPDFEALAKSNPSFLQRLAQENVAAFGVKSARGNFFPKVTASAGAGRTGTHWLPKDDQWDAGLALSFPFFEGGLKTAQLAQARAVFNQAQANKRSSSDSILVSLEQAWAALQDAVELVEVRSKALAAAEERSRIASEEYALGFISYDNWSIIEDNLVQSKKVYLDAQANALLAEANWIQAKGDTLEYAQK